MLRADELTVVHHDDTVSHFTDVAYTIGREGIRLITATGDEKAFPQHDVLTTVALTRAPVPTQVPHTRYAPELIGSEGPSPVRPEDQPPPSGAAEMDLAAGDPPTAAEALSACWGHVTK